MRAMTIQPFVTSNISFFFLFCFSRKIWPEDGFMRTWCRFFFRWLTGGFGFGCVKKPLTGFYGAPFGGLDLAWKGCLPRDMRIL